MVVLPSVATLIRLRRRCQGDAHVDVDSNLWNEGLRWFSCTVNSVQVAICDPVFLVLLGVAHFACAGAFFFTRQDTAHAHYRHVAADDWC